MNHHEAGHGGYIGTRREFLSRCGMGMGALAMGGLPSQVAAGTSPLLPKQPQVEGKAKAVIHLFMNGGAIAG
ncbi:twin-arginine translocation signal domain-containing protein [Akkermansiaceae bacterium]|nr:twin-arginine translocation signal domain-containing protein [Akkermansiaceae bacterium]